MSLRLRENPGCQYILTIAGIISLLFSEFLFNRIEIDQTMSITSGIQYHDQDDQHRDHENHLKQIVNLGLPKANTIHAIPIIIPASLSLS